MGVTMFRTFAAFCATFLFLLMTAGHGDCQSGPASSPVLGFDVASIKPTGSPDVRLRMQFAPGGAFTATAATLLALVRQAYDVEDVQITGARGWMASDRFDVSAKLTDARPGISEQELGGCFEHCWTSVFSLRRIGSERNDCLRPERRCDWPEAEAMDWCHGSSRRGRRTSGDDHPPYNHH